MPTNPCPAVGDGRPLRPVVARALELGRGPAVVVGWLSARPHRPPDRRLVARLAGDLARRLRGDRGGTVRAISPLTVARAGP